MEPSWIRLRKHLGAKYGLGLMLALVVVMIVMQSSWLRAQYDLRFTKRFTSAEGKFSMDIPKSWFVKKASNMSSGGEKVYLNAHDEITKHRSRVGQSSRRLMYADVTVTMTTLTAGPAPSVKELSDALLTSRREGRARVEALLDTLSPGSGNLLPGPNINAPSSKTRFEIKRLKGYPWGKTTLADAKETCVFWHAVDDNLNCYTVTFETDKISHYERIFDNMMKSFSFDSLQ